jgi:signal transduction histidine kinase
MSLRVRLVIVIVALVTLLAAALSTLHLELLITSLSADQMARSEWAAEQTQAFISGKVNQRFSEFKPPAGFQETVTLWNNIISSETEVPSALSRILASSPAIVEINVAGESGKILASTEPSRVDGPLPVLPKFSAWRALPWHRRLLDLFSVRPDYQVTKPLGVPGQANPIFTVQVVASSVLLRDQLMPEVESVAIISGGALVISLLLTGIATNWLLQPLKRIEQTIDRIVQGSFRRPEHQEALAKEFAAVESKLNILGERFTGARQEATEMQHNVEHLLERMASQLDVASRLTAISRITGGVAHEIKNPLNAIALHLDLMRERLGGPEEALASEIDILSKEVRRLDRVVKTFLDFSRPVDVRLEKVDLAALAREVAELMTPQARLAKIDLSFAEPPPPIKETTMRGDPDMLKQVVLNLVTNALDAMKNGGTLRLSVSRAEDAVTLEVADDGPGIPPDLRAKVFQLYFTTKPQGSGIGLAMTYRAVQLHNGTIDFTSEDGRGTTFRLQFPALVGHA